MIHRRTFLCGLTLGALARPLAAEGQQAGKIYRIGALFVTPPDFPPGQGPAAKRLAELGWVYGRDYVVEVRTYGDRIERVPELAAELIRHGVDVFFVAGGADAWQVRTVTQTIPIVTYAA